MDGFVDEVEDTFDTDKLCYEDIKKLVLSFGYLKFKSLWYQHPKFSFQGGLKPLNNDADLLELVTDARGCNVVEVFVEHEVDIPEVVDFCDESPLVEELRDEDDGSDVEEVVMEEVRNARTAEVKDESVNNEGENYEGEINDEVMDEPDVINDVNEDDEEDGYVSEEDEGYVGSGGESEFDTDFDIVDDGEEQWDWTHELHEDTFAACNQGGVNNEGNETQAVDEGSSQDESDLHSN